MKPLKMLLIVLAAVLFLTAYAEDYPDMDFAPIYPQLIMGEPFPEELIDTLGKPMPTGAGKYTVYMKNSEGETLNVGLSYYAGAVRITSIGIYSMSNTAASDECGIFPAAGGTRLEQLEEMEGIEGLETEAFGDNKTRAAFIYNSVSYEALFEICGGENVMYSLEILDTPAALERKFGKTDSAITLEDMNSAVILETTMDELTAKYPGYYFDDQTHQGRPYVSLTYTLHDCTHFTYWLILRDGEYVVEAMFWVPEAQEALYAEPEAVNASRQPQADDFSFLKIGETTYDEVAKRYMDMYGLDTGNRPDIVIANRDGEQVALYFGRRNYTDDNSVLYAIQNFTDNLWLNGVLMRLPVSVK